MLQLIDIGLDPSLDTRKRGRLEQVEGLLVAVQGVSSLLCSHSTCAGWLGMPMVSDAFRLSPGSARHASAVPPPPPCIRRSEVKGATVSVEVDPNPRFRYSRGAKPIAAPAAPAPARRPTEKESKQRARSGLGGVRKPEKVELSDEVGRSSGRQSCPLPPPSFVPLFLAVCSILRTGWSVGGVLQLDALRVGCVVGSE